MKVMKIKLLPLVVIAALCLVMVSAMPGAGGPVAAYASEADIVGGAINKCAAAWGLGLSLALASLSPCGVLCASLAYYDLALIGAYC